MPPTTLLTCGRHVTKPQDKPHKNHQRLQHTKDPRRPRLGLRKRFVLRRILALSQANPFSDKNSSWQLAFECVDYVEFYFIELTASSLKCALRKAPVRVCSVPMPFNSPAILRISHDRAFALTSTRTDGMTVSSVGSMETAMTCLSNSTLFLTSQSTALLKCVFFPIRQRVALQARISRSAFVFQVCSNTSLIE